MIHCSFMKDDSWAILIVRQHLGVLVKIMFIASDAIACTSGMENPVRLRNLLTRNQFLIDLLLTVTTDVLRLLMLFTS